MIGSDGPVVNKKVFSLMNEEVKEHRKTGLVNPGTCNLHIVHNSFLSALEIFGSEVSEFIIDVYYFFRNWPNRKSDYETVQSSKSVKTHNFINMFHQDG